ncbi:hypothetical protein [Chamaesiphon sp. VAR_48_metabat_403]|uniref:hypothetical protein n=1 Tax=Chamaesiphon sp. VAR_48_metabat_403 TaxID=2964700 RepID=UPI00286DDDFB|nr:hypothetical protein [Chamaesiphon sp. VAR_48_metabat_403]
MMKIEILLLERLTGTDLMLVFKNKTAAIRMMSSTIAKIEAIKSRQSFKMRITESRSKATIV